MKIKKFTKEEDELSRMKKSEKASLVITFIALAVAIVIVVAMVAAVIDCVAPAVYGS